MELSTTIYLIGNALGAVLISPLSDRYGRKRVMLACLWIQGALGVGVAFVQSYVMFVVIRFFIGFLNMVGLNLNVVYFLLKPFKLHLQG